MCFDVLVVGAGPAGAVCARTLALAGHRVLLVDDVRSSNRKVGENLIGAARPLLRDLGLLPWVELSEPVTCSGTLSAWGEDVLRSNDFIRDPNGIGWCLDRPRFDSCLREAAIAVGAQWRQVRLNAVQKDSAGWRASLSDGVVSARWIIDASGRRSILARRLGVSRRQDSDLVALYTWRQSQSQETRTVVESSPHGWWYTATLPHERQVVALHVGAADASHIMRKQSEWSDLLAATQHIRGKCEPATPASLFSTDASGSSLDSWGGERWLAVGDAALAFDPLSSQGIFNALYTGLRGAQAVIGALAGRQQTLTKYSQQLMSIREAYLHQVAHFYQAEQRWRGYPFWDSRG
ncbi:tryptophan 7-halogenase [Pseudomonas frederiksbergensis]|uniref:tryptophan 7-halogenase n=1 Tax=Pseudomonas frederiksbergensis TaxID=104087 RepID=UPI003D2298D6